MLRRLAVGPRRARHRAGGRAVRRTREAAPLTKVLVFSKTAGFRHSSIPNGIAAIQQLGSANGFTVTATEDAAPVHHRQPGPVPGRGLPLDDRRRAERHAADGVRVVHRQRQGLRRRPRRRRHRVRLALVRRPGRRLLPVAPGDPAGDGAGRGPHATRRRRTCRPPGSAPTSGTTTGPTRGPTSACWRSLDETTYSGGTMAATTRSPGARTTAAGAPGTPASATPRQSYTDSNFTRMLLGGIQCGRRGATATARRAHDAAGDRHGLRAARANNRFVTRPAPAT